MSDMRLRRGRHWWSFYIGRLEVTLFSCFGDWTLYHAWSNETHWGLNITIGWQLWILLEKSR